MKRFAKQLTAFMFMLLLVLTMAGCGGSQAADTTAGSSMESELESAQTSSGTESEPEFVEFESVGEGTESDLTAFESIDAAAEAGDASVESELSGSDGVKEAQDAWDSMESELQAAEQEHKEAANAFSEAAEAAKKKKESGTSNTESTGQSVSDDGSVTENGVTVTEDGEYNQKEEVALYIHTFGHLPSNYITKSKAKKLGWRTGNVQEEGYGLTIGGDNFSNREGALPQKKGRTYRECDIDTLLTDRGRGPERIVWSNDGLIFYTGDHYETFEQLY